MQEFILNNSNFIINIYHKYDDRKSSLFSRNGEFVFDNTDQIEQAKKLFKENGLECKIYNHKVIENLKNINVITELISYYQIINEEFEIVFQDKDNIQHKAKNISLNKMVDIFKYLGTEIPKPLIKLINLEKIENLRGEKYTLIKVNKEIEVIITCNNFQEYKSMVKNYFRHDFQENIPIDEWSSVDYFYEDNNFELNLENEFCQFSEFIEHSILSEENYYTVKSNYNVTYELKEIFPYLGKSLTDFEEDRKLPLWYIIKMYEYFSDKKYNNEDINEIWDYLRDECGFVFETINVIS